MNCEEFARQLDTLDTSQDLSKESALNRHAQECAECAALLQLFQRALTLCLVPPAALDRDLSLRIMNQVLLQARPQRVLALRFWLVAGFVLLLAGLLPPLLVDYHHLAGSMGNDFLIPLALVLGSAVSLYMLVFVGTHMITASNYVKKHHIMGY
ncbi:MAG: hypothetical protein KKI09_16220 [Spirochaetes bacterium]|nr:hypothetical protein [Spirochaetota bacterium]MBU0956969.1 hypothetical protein [Spirochaetota bacterium]